MIGYEESDYHFQLTFLHASEMPSNTTDAFANTDPVTPALQIRTHGLGYGT